MTRISQANQTIIDEAAALLRGGELVAFPTETVYGLGADAENDRAVAEIYAAKGRPSFNPLIVHVADMAMAARYAEFTSLAEQLAASFWPGPLTLVLKRRVDCALSLLLSAGLDSVAIRVPAHPVAHALIAAVGRGIAAPSANRSGRVSPTCAVHVEEELAGRIPLILDGGACEVGLESTVIDCTDSQPTILRHGGVTREALEGSGKWQVASGKAEERGGMGQGMASPGMLASHYAPSLPVRLNAECVEEGEALLAFGPPLPHTGAMENLSFGGDLTEAAANLFALLRKLDRAEYRGIAVMSIPEEGLGAAINDRLRRATVR